MSIRYRLLLAGLVLCSGTALVAQEKKQHEKIEQTGSSELEVRVEKLGTSEAVVPLTEEFKAQFILQIKKNALLESKLNAEILAQRYKGDSSITKIFQKVIYDRKVAIEILALNPVTPPNTFLMKKIMKRADSVIERYTYAAKNKLIANSKVLDDNDNSKFGFAVRNGFELKLSTAQKDSMITHSYKLIALKSEGKNAKEYERRILPKILSDDQYTRLLIMGSKKQALTWASGDWKELQDRGLTDGLDSAKAVNDIYNHNLARLVRLERFGNNPPKMTTSLKSLETPQPEALRRIRQARAYNNPIPEKAQVSSKFTW